MTKVISFANQKGGVGKSSTCIQLAFFLAEKKKKVLVLDFDGQGNTSSRLAPRTDFEGETEVLFSGTKTAELFNDDCDVQVMNCRNGIDLIHTPKNDPELFEMEAIPLDKALNPSKNLSDILSQYEYVLIDCPPSLGRKLVAALIISTHVVCPVQLSGFAVDGVEGLLNTIIGVQQSYNRNLEISGILINNMDKSVNHDKALKQLKDTVPELLFNNIIMHRPPLDSATSEGVPVWSLRYGHVAAKEVIAVLEEIIERVN